MSAMSPIAPSPELSWIHKAKTFPQQMQAYYCIQACNHPRTCCVFPKADSAGVAAKLLLAAGPRPVWGENGTKCVTLSMPLASMLTCKNQHTWDIDSQLDPLHLALFFTLLLPYLQFNTPSIHGDIGSLAMSQ